MGRRNVTMSGGRLLAVVAVVAAVLAGPGASAWGAPTAASVKAAAEQRLRAYQAQYLDPRADTGEFGGSPDTAGTTGTTGTAGTAGTTGTAGSGMGAMTMGSTTHASLALTDGSPPPEVGGRWDYLPPFPPEFNAIHVVTSPTGKVLLIAGSGNDKNVFAAGTFTSYIWDPMTQERRMIPTPSDLFCSGHVLMSDGRALVGGGTGSYGPFTGVKAMYAFDFETETYDALAPLQVGRWYPTVVTAPDGRQLFVGGFDENGKRTSIPEIYDPVADTTTILPARKTFPNYPRLHLAANGKYFFATTAAPGFWDPFTGRFTKVPGGTSAAPNAMASCFVGDVRDQTLMVMGGGWPATSATRVIDLDAPTPAFTPGPSLAAAKAYLGCVNLPDGSLFEANGGSDNKVSAASSEAAILRDVASGWAPAAPLPAGEHRLYHALLYLLDSGQVVSTSSNPYGGADRSTSVLVYSPPYLFTGERPTITAAPDEVTYGGTYPVAATSTGATVDRFTVTSASSPTHGLDANQRYLSLPVVDGTITLPTSRTILPPGWYRLWALDSAGRPSVAHWFHLG